MSMNYQTNGCGACKGFWKFLNPLLPQHNFFKEECNKHDVDYEIGGDKKDKLKADLTLLYNMKLKTKLYFYKRKWFSKQWYIIIAYLYYIGVRVGGNNNFNFK